MSQNKLDKNKLDLLRLIALIQAVMIALMKVMTKMCSFLILSNLDKPGSQLVIKAWPLMESNTWDNSPKSIMKSHPTNSFITLSTIMLLRRRDPKEKQLVFSRWIENRLKQFPEKLSRSSRSLMTNKSTNTWNNISKEHGSISM